MIDKIIDGADSAFLNKTDSIDMKIKKEKLITNATISLNIVMPQCSDINKYIAKIKKKINHFLGGTIIGDIKVDITSQWMQEQIVDMPDHMYDWKAIVELIRSELKRRTSFKLTINNSNSSARIYNPLANCYLTYDVKTNTIESRYINYNGSVKASFKVSDPQYYKQIVDWILTMPHKQ